MNKMHKNLVNLIFSYIEEVYVNYITKKWEKISLRNAVIYGLLDVCKAKKHLINRNSTWICAYAALNGHFEILKWARENGCPWNEYTCSNAAKNGHFEILKWARENGCPCGI